MLDDIEEHDNVHHFELREIALVGRAGDHAQSLSSAMGGGVFRDLDARHVEEAPCFPKEETVGAPDFKQPPSGAMLADVIHGAGKFASKHGLGATIVHIAVRMPAGEI